LPELERICNQLNMGFSKEEIEKMVYKASNGTGRVYFDQFTEMMKD
jgi:Ca2+-binding EF-hand superfamily protein